MSSRPLNFLWFSMEDTTARFGCYGDALARTPNLDRLASEGCRYASAFCTSGVCAPSRASIITGCYATWLGAHHMRTSARLGLGQFRRDDVALAQQMPTSARIEGDMGPYECVPPAYVKCFTEYLRAAGYYCTNNSKTDYQFHPPLTAWDQCGPEGHWRNRRDPSQPFFAVFNPMWTHESGMWREKYETWSVGPGMDPSAVTMPPWLPDTRPVRESLARQYDNIALADEKLGELLRQLEEDGERENTVVMVWSDHGEGLPRAKRTPYDAGIRVPLIVRWPGTVEPGTVAQELVSLIDLGPTVLSLAGLELPRHLQGRPFLGQANVPREHVFAHRDRLDIAYDMQRAVRDRRFKYIRNFYPGMPHFSWMPYPAKHEAFQELRRLDREGKLEGAARALMDPRRAEELYDLEADPHELTNLAGKAEFEGELRRLRGVLDEWRRDYDRWGDVDESVMVAQMWPGGEQPQTAPVEFIPWSEGYDGQQPQAGGEFHGPVVLQLQSNTQGASIAYTTEAGESARWLLYTMPLRLPEGMTVVRTKAIRIGFRESEEKAATFVVSSSRG